MTRFTLLVAAAVSFASRYRGLFQRIAEVGLFGGLALSLWLTR